METTVNNSKLENILDSPLFDTHGFQMTE